MAMKLVKKTSEYSIYQRGDNRYALKDANKKPINGEEKTRILTEEELIKAVIPAKPAVEEAPEAAAEEAETTEDAAEAEAGDSAEEAEK